MSATLKLITTEEKYSDNDGAYDVCHYWDGEQIIQETLRGDSAQPTTTIRATKKEVAQAVEWYKANNRIRPDSRKVIGHKFIVRGSRKVKKDTLVTVVDFYDTGRYGYKVAVKDEEGQVTDGISPSCLAEWVESPAPYWEGYGEEEPTVSYIAKPQDSRCSWWSMQLPADLELNGDRIKAPYLRTGADLELAEGDMLIDSEAMHHRKNRGYAVSLGVCLGGAVKWLNPTAETKAYIKAHGGQDLMRESGDVAAVIRAAVWLRRQPDLATAFEELRIA